MALIEAITRFASTVGRNGKDTTDVQVVPTPIPPPDDLSLTGELAVFYARLGFEKLTIGGEFFLKIVASSRLKNAQTGWRWISKAPSQELLENPKWDKNWVVFGDRNGDALIAKTSQSNCPVFGLVQGEEYQLSSSLKSFLNAMSDCLVMEQLEYGFDTHDEDFTVYEKFIDSTRQIVKKHESDEIVEEFIGFFFE